MNRDILENTVLALLAKAPGLGEIQLRKALVMVDILNESYYGKGLTGTTYIKDRFGPVPDHDSMQVIWDMSRRGDLSCNEEPVGTWTKHAYYRMKDPNYDLLTADQISFIQAAARFAVKNSAKNLSDMTHDAVYHRTLMGQAIPLSAMLSIRVTPSKRLTEVQKKEVRSAIEADDDFILRLCEGNTRAAS